MGAAGFYDRSLATETGERDRVLKLRLDPFGVSVAPLAFDDAVSRVVGWAQDGSSGRFVCLANVHMLVEATRHGRLARALRRADLVLPDGMPLVWMLLREVPSAARIAGMDFLPALCAGAAGAGIPVYFWGGREETLAAIRLRLGRELPRLRIAGMRPAGLGRVPLPERTRALREIATSGARLVFVGLGCPRQELWMDRHRDTVRGVMVGVGGAVDVFAGVRRRAPEVFQRNGLEWTYRLLQDPRRMGPRYLDTNAAFLWRLLRHSLRWPFGGDGDGNRSTVRHLRPLSLDGFAKPAGLGEAPRGRASRRSMLR